MKKTTLIIHPDDRTTDFLKPIYSDMPDKTVITGAASPEEVYALIPNHSRIMMMGHGSPDGLLSMGKFGPACPFYIIGHETVPLLAGKEAVFVWCNANRFVERHPTLSGFYSGMFISEVLEAKICGLGTVTQKMVDDSNSCFSAITGSIIHLPQDKMYESLLQSEYKNLSAVNPVAKYNYERLYYRAEAA